MPGAVEQAALRAARLGDSAAAECYIILANQSMHPGTSCATPNAPVACDLAARDTFVRNARFLLERGLASGDWRMVSMAAMTANPREPGWIHALADPADATLSYRMHRLMQRGARDVAYREQFAKSADFEQGWLGAADLRTADRWVDATYASRFFDKPLFAYGSLCPIAGAPEPPY